MSERVVWVVERLQDGDWKPLNAISYTSEASCKGQATKLRRKDAPIQYRAWLYAAKESAQ